MNRLVVLKFTKKARSLVLKVSVSIGWPNKRLKRDCQRVAVFVQIGICDYGCYFEFSVLRCQPLNRALYFFKFSNQKDP